MEENNSKEINLLDLVRMFFNWLKNIFIGFFRLSGESLRLLYRNKLTAGVILIIFILLGYYMGRPSKREYKAEAMAILNGSSSQTVKEVSRQLESSSHLSDFTTLSNKLSLPDSVAGNITQIASYYVIDFLNVSTPDMVDFKGKHPLNDTLNVRMPNRLYFRIKTRKVNEIPIFEKAFLNYFNTNERLVKEFNIKKNNLSREIDLMRSEIQRLDSLAEKSYLKDTDPQLQLRYNTLLIIGEQKKQLLHTEFLSLQETLLKREMEFANFTEPVVLPTGFIVNTRHETGRLTYLIIFGLIGAIVACLVCLLIENRKCVFNYLSKK